MCFFPACELYTDGKISRRFFVFVKVTGGFLTLSMCLRAAPARELAAREVRIPRTIVYFLIRFPLPYDTSLQLGTRAIGYLFSLPLPFFSFSRARAVTTRRAPAGKSFLCKRGACMRSVDIVAPRGDVAVARGVLTDFFASDRRYIRAICGRAVE